VRSFEVIGLLHEVIGLAKVATTPLRARPMVVCCAAANARVASEPGTPLTTRPLSYRHASDTYSCVLCAGLEAVIGGGASVVLAAKAELKEEVEAAGKTRSPLLVRARIGRRSSQHVQDFVEAFVHFDLGPVFERKPVILADKRIRPHGQKHADDRNADESSVGHRIVQCRSAVTSPRIQLGLIRQDRCDNRELLMPAGEVQKCIAIGCFHGGKRRISAERGCNPTHIPALGHGGQLFCRDFRTLYQSPGLLAVEFGIRVVTGGSKPLPAQRSWYV
jgi:hypothetical protein